MANHQKNREKAEKSLKSALLPLDKSLKKCIITQDEQIAREL
jgi:hypothetical protein